MKVHKIVLSKAIDSPFCVSNEDGVMIHDLIAASFEKNEAVEISFLGVTRLTTAFLNAAVGQLYDEFQEGKINNLLSYIDCSASHLSKIDTTIENAKVFFRDSKDQGRIVRGASIEDEE